MLAEPITITIDGTAFSFRRTSVPNNGVGVFKEPSGLYTLEILQSETKSQQRFNARLTKTLYGSDQINPSINRLYKSQVWGGAFVPAHGVGITVSETDKMLVGLNAWLATAGNRTSLFNGES